MDEQGLDKLISQTINTQMPQFDAAGWKEKHPAEFEMLKSRAGQITPIRSSIGRRIMKSRITTLAAAVIVIAVGFLVIHTRPRPQTRTDGPSQAAKTPGEMLTVLSLNTAYRKGGMGAVEQQYEKAFRILGPRVTSISVQDLLAECNTDWKGKYYERD